MGLFRAPERPVPPNTAFSRPQRRSRRSLLIFLLLVIAGVKILQSQSPRMFHPLFFSAKPSLPIVPIGPGEESPPLEVYRFNGTRIRGNGTDIDLGDRRTHLPGSLLIGLFPREMVVPSCLTQAVPSTPAPLTNPNPVRDDWPGFYGAPWIAHLNGNLIALLHVFAPRRGSGPTQPPEFQIYPRYDGQQSAPGFDIQAPAMFQRGSKAVLYRVFMDGPLRCLDLVVQNGANNGIGHLYYQKYHHYYQMDTVFQIQP